MDRHTPLIYLVQAMFILLCHKIANLNACPLSGNNNITTATPCNQCNVLRHIHMDPTRQINVNLMVALNLGRSENSAGEFARKMSSDQNQDYFFDSISLPGMVRNCFGSEQSANTGSPCTDFIRMDGAGKPGCTWNYTCDYSPNRFPQYIWRANCAEAPDKYRSQEVFYEIPTLMYNSEGSSCLPFINPVTTYTWTMEKVAVACVCVPHATWIITDYTKADTPKRHLIHDKWHPNKI